VAEEQPSITLSAELGPRHDEILTEDALAFLADLHRRFDGRRLDLLAQRDARQADFDDGELPDFLPSTKDVREGDWRVAPPPEEILDRRIEMTGAVSRAALAMGLNSNARVYMGDFEDAMAPTWANLLDGQVNVRDRWHDQLDGLGDTPSVLMTRPRGLHLPEAHVVVDGSPISGAFFDFGLLAFHNAAAAIAKGSHPYFYLAKLESHLEARLWRDIFAHTEEALGIQPGSIKATVLIETLPAAFEMHEILHELKDHAVGLTTGRWDHIFSLIKTFRTRPSYLLPDRDGLDMGDAFLRAYSELMIQTCHRRGTFALGGMSAYIPVDNDAAANEKALADIRKDKEREAKAGHDGTWVAHPALIEPAQAVFDDLMPGPNQLDRQRDDLEITQFDLLEIHDGARSEAGLRDNIRTGIQYLEAWLRGEGAVPLGGVIEDAAIAEISRTQIWQQLHFEASLAEGSKATPALYSQFLNEEMERVKNEIGEDAYQSGRFAEAIALFTELSMAEELQPFLTLSAYRQIA